MLIRILVVVGIAILFYVGIKILVRTLPGSMKKETLDGIRKLGDVPIAVNPGMSFGQLGATFIKKIVLQGALGAVVPAVVVSEQKKVLNAKIAKIRRRVTRLNSGRKIKYFVSPITCMEEMIISWKKMMSNDSFDCNRVLAEIEGMNQVIQKYVPHIREVEGMFCEAYELLEQVKNQVEDTEILEAVSELEGTIDNYKSLRIDFEDIDAILSLKEELSKIIVSLKQCLMIDGCSENEKNYYEILGIDSTATQNEIKKAYRKLQIKYHPDRKAAELGKIDDEDIKVEVERVFEEKVSLFNEAYGVLSDLEKRKEYDALL